MKPKPPLEKEVQRRVVALYKSAGCFVYVLSQGYRHERGGTRQTKGLPDLYVFPPGCSLALPWWHEVKRPGGKPSPEQVEFNARCEARGVYCLIGGYRQALEHLLFLDLWKLPPGVLLDDVAPDA